MFNWLTYTALLTKITFTLFISLFTWSHISGNCDCHSLTCHCRNVKFIPLLPSNITSVTLHNSVCFLENKFMANLSSLALAELHFENVKIVNSEKDIFLNFPHLKKLTFRNLDTNVKILINAFNSLHLTNISKLEIYALKISSFINLLLKTLNGTNIKELSLIRCKVTMFNSSYWFPSLRNLQSLNLSGNFINQASWSHANHLKVLVLKHSRIKLPTFLASNSTPFFPNLKYLQISVKHLEEMNSSTFEGLDNLEYLYFGTENIISISAGFLHPISKLKSFHIEAFSYDLISVTVEYGAFKSDQLQHLQIELFRLKINYKGSLFRHTPNLLSLKLKFTRLFLFDHELNEELMPLKKLETFVMTYSALKNVPNALCYIPSLTRIDLGQNIITHWNNTNCPVMSRLQFLSLSKNEIHIIERNTFSPQLIDNDQLIWDLSLNDFLCNCRILWFLNWLLQRQNRFLFYPRDYVCAIPLELKGKVLNSSLFSDGQCSTKNTSLIITLVSLLGSLTVIVIVITSLLYYKRWNIRYIFYLIRSRHKQKKEHEGIHNYLFDAFVCYHNSDMKWLLNELCPKLEKENNFTLCIHDRDFVAGWDIVENIVESIEKSRKVLLLLSNEFACSHWCRFEMAMAHQRVIEREENLLIIVLLEDINISNQSHRLTSLLKQKTYLKWTNNKEGQALFWHRLISCLKAPNVQET